MRAHCDLGGGRFRVRTPTGGFCVVAPNTPTDIVVDDPHEILVCAIPAAHLVPLLVDAGRSGELFDFGRLHTTILQSAGLEALMARMWEAAASPLPASRLAVDGAMLTMLSELLLVAERPLAPARGGLAPWQIRRCVEYLAEHAGENVGLEQLAELVGLSPFHFARGFKHSTGLPPHRYQLNLRIARAKALLKGTDAPVTEIALEVGYESSQALARLFRREVGLTPSDYRRHHRL
jgi:AraC family transcriptional regulator